MLNYDALKSDISLTIEKRINSFFEDYRQNIAILMRDKGESNWLLETYIYSNKHEGITYISEDVSYINAKDFFRNVSFSILTQCIPGEEPFDKLLNICENILPATVNYIKNTLKKKVISFLDILELLNKFISESGKKCIFIIQEFHNLKEMFKNFHQDFAKFIILQKMCMVILTSSKINEAKRILGTDLHLLFGNFEILSYEYISWVDSYLYFMRLLKPLNPKPHFISFFINILQANTTYYRFIAQELKNMLAQGDEEEMITKIIENILYKKDSYLYQKFINNIEIIKERYKDFRTLIKILFLISEGYIRKSDIAFFLGLDKKTVALKLQRLVDIEYIENLGNIYKLTDSLFSFWLLNVFRLHISGHILDKNKKYSLFRKKIKEEIELFKEYFYKEKVQRIRELFSSFHNDTLIIERNRIKCPLLNKIKIISYPEKGLNLLVGEGEEIVFAGVKEGETKETDILNFEIISNSIKVKNLRKIFISLGALNSAAKLIAKESKIYLWDINQINNIMSIYKKPVLL